MCGTACTEEQEYTQGQAQPLRVCVEMSHSYSDLVQMWCRSHENVADMLGISRLEADGPPAPLYPPGNPSASVLPSLTSVPRLKLVLCGLTCNVCVLCHKVMQEVTPLF